MKLDIPPEMTRESLALALKDALERERLLKLDIEHWKSSYIKLSEILDT